MAIDKDQFDCININSEPATFEEAITATKYGIFNILLYIITIPAVLATIFETTTIAYVVPMAQCDLNLTLEEKGYLLSTTFLGMVFSATIWGFLSDTIGRRKIIITGLFINCLVVIISAFSQSFTVLIICKFLGGIMISGPHAIAATIISEYHCMNYRARAILGIGIIASLANLIIPILALAVFSNPINIDWFNHQFKIHSWNILILITAIPNFISALGYFLWIPETPKFLMTSGRNEDALNVFKLIYSKNTGKHPNTFPIKVLIDETKTYASYETVSSDKWQAVKNGFSQMKPILFPPHISKLILICFLEFGTMMSFNSLRLWLPQLFTFINDYIQNHGNEANICTVLNEMVYQNMTTTKELATSQPLNNNTTIIQEVINECTVNSQNNLVYYNSMINSIGSIFGYFLAGTLINLLGKKIIFVWMGSISGLSAIGIYFAPNSWSVTALSTLCLALTAVNSSVLISITVDLFPTALRTMAVAIALAVARLGSMIGNLILPYLINAGCWPPFVYIGMSTIVCAIVAIQLLPKTNSKHLQ